MRKIIALLMLAMGLALVAACGGEPAADEYPHDEYPQADEAEDPAAKMPGGAYALLDCDANPSIDWAAMPTNIITIDGIDYVGRFMGEYDPRYSSWRYEFWRLDCAYADFSQWPIFQTADHTFGLAFSEYPHYPEIVGDEQVFVVRSTTGRPVLTTTLSVLRSDGQNTLPLNMYDVIMRIDGGEDIEWAFRMTYRSLGRD